jgi:hypothetical protein
VDPLVRGVDYHIKIKFGEHLAMKSVLGSGANPAHFFYFNAAENLAGRGSRETVSRKILFSKNLEAKS